MPTMCFSGTCRVRSIHYEKHHLAYVANGNKASSGTEFEGRSLEDVVIQYDGCDDRVFDKAGQHYSISGIG
jgi:Fe-Mn family superoxide dismutase